MHVPIIKKVSVLLPCHTFSVYNKTFVWPLLHGVVNLANNTLWVPFYKTDQRSIEQFQTRTGTDYLLYPNIKQPSLYLHRCHRGTYENF